MSIRNMQYIMRKGIESRGLAQLAFYPYSIARLYRRQYLLDASDTAYRVSQAGVSRTWIHHICGPELPDCPQPLHFRSLQDAVFIGGQANIAVERITNHVR